jgi:antitoxin HicB
MKYSMKIEWSEEDDCYVVFLPEFTKAMQPVSDGKTYMEAAQNGGDALESIVASYLAEGWSLPQPQTLANCLAIEFEQNREIDTIVSY